MNRFTIANFFLLLCCCLATSQLYAQNWVEVSGKLQEEGTNEPLILSNIYAMNSKKGTVTDESGQFFLELRPGADTLRVSYIGYRTKDIPLILKKDTTMFITMERLSTKLMEVELNDSLNYAFEKLDRTEMGTITLTTKDFSRLPSIIGEADIIKAIQLLPGVNKGVEGSSDLFVRGGDADQNLVLLDGTTVYNTGHLFGFLSVFNPDIIKEANLIKGAFPANYGGRLSSVLDIRTKSDIAKKTEVSGMIGLLSSSISIAQPIKEDKLGIRIGARRTYIDQILKTLDSEVQIPYYFYDLNGRVDWIKDEKNKFYLNAYYGQDVLDISRARRNNDDEETDPEAEEEETEGTFQSNFDTENSSLSVGWTHQGNEVKSEMMLSRTFYSYKFDNSFLDDGIKVFSDIEDYGLDWRLSARPSDDISWSAGISGISHDISPSVLETEGILAEFIESSRSEGLYSLEAALYGHMEKKLDEKWLLNLGFRQSFATGDNSWYTGAEPRLAMRYKIDGERSVKASYSLMRQYMHRVSTSTVSLPVDLWYSITDDIKPQSSHQFSLGYVQSFPKRKISLELESYVKFMKNITEYEEGTNLVFSTDFEDALLQGEGRAYGFELFARKEHYKWSAWLSYALSWADRQFDDLNGGSRFPAKYDRRHTFSFAAQYDLNERWSFSTIWEYISGSRFTPIIGQYAVVNPGTSGVELQNIYSSRNEVRLSDSHRLDLAFILKSKPEKRFQTEWHFGIYNVYNRATPISISIGRNADGSFRYEQPGLFGMIPSVSYKFKW